MMRGMTSQLVRLDDKQLWARQIPSVSSQIDAWKYFLPKTANLELRLATEGINNISLPADFKAVKLPAGEHTVFLKSTNNDAEGYLDQVYIDDDLVLTSKHPATWLNSSGSGWKHEVSGTSATYELQKPIALKRSRYSISHSFRKWFSERPPDEYDAKGACLWIAPATHAPLPAPKFVSHGTPNFRQSNLGHRQGMRLMQLRSADSRGFLGVRAAYDAVLGDNHSRGSGTNWLSVRPITDETNVAEVPESQRGQFSSNVGAGLKIAMSNSLDPPESMERYAYSPMDVSGTVSEDGQTMRVFCHYERFNSGAQPILEVIFRCEVSRPNWFSAASSQR